MSGYFDVVRSEIEGLLPENPSLIMDVGCGEGATSSWLKQIRPCARTVGVELNRDAAELAASRLDTVIVADLDDGVEPLSDYHGSVGLLLLLDVLEHLKDPWTRLREFARLLTSNGVVVASVPNVRNLKVLVPLVIKGDWRYRSSGVLDRTHLRFFTRRTVIELFEESGFEIEEIVATGPLQRTRVKSAAGALAFAANFLLGGVLRDFLTHQYLIRAVRRPQYPAAEEAVRLRSSGAPPPAADQIHQPGATLRAIARIPSMRRWVGWVYERLRWAGNPTGETLQGNRKTIRSLPWRLTSFR